MRSALTWGTHWTASAVTLEWKKQLRLSTSGYCSLSFQSSLLNAGPPLTPEKNVGRSGFSVPGPACLLWEPPPQLLPACSQGRWWRAAAAPEQGCALSWVSETAVLGWLLTPSSTAVSPLVLIYTVLCILGYKPTKSNQNPAEVQVRAMQQAAHQCLLYTFCL